MTPPLADTLTLSLVDSIAKVSASDWDALGSPNDPFSEHVFLKALEDSACVGAGTGWLPQHLLVHQGERLLGAMHLSRPIGASSLHVLFCPEAEQRQLLRIGMIGRMTHQYHWTNQGYTSFEQWLSTFRSRRRKECRRERRMLQGVTIHDLPGDALNSAQRRAVRAFYEDTCHKRGGYPYLRPAIFDLFWTRLPHRSRVLLAEFAGSPVAMSLLFCRGKHLYGRYWGCQPGFEHLHFELCYHRPIEICIHEGLDRFEAGAQGVHKIQRGLVPSPILVPQPGGPRPPSCRQPIELSGPPVGDTRPLLEGAVRRSGSRPPSAFGAPPRRSLRARSARDTALSLVVEDFRTRALVGSLAGPSRIESRSCRGLPARSGRDSATDDRAVGPRPLSPRRPRARRFAVTGLCPALAPSRARRPSGHRQFPEEQTG